MIFDDYGLPKPTGASDFQDSAALAGIMVTFNWPFEVRLFRYVTDNTLFSPAKYVRHPHEIKYDFSRDQAICLVAGLSKQVPELVDAEFITGKDFLSPSVRGHIERCKGGKATWFQDLWFWCDLWFSAKVKPMEELNQLFCMMMVANPKFIRWYCQNNPRWERALIDYWCGWRNEPELTNHMITEIDKRLK